MTIVASAIPCPFCRHPEVDAMTERWCKWASLECTKCGARGPEVRTNHEPEGPWIIEATKLWNERA